MKFAITEIVEFDYDKEISRINDYFEEPWSSRLLEIMGAFKNEEYEKVVDLHEKLPYDEEDECLGQEYCNYKITEVCYNFIYYPETIKKIE